MMENRRILSEIFGITQCVIGALFAVLAIMLYLNFLEVHAVFTLPPELLPLYLLILGLFGGFSIMSGLFLIREWWRQT